MRRYAWAALALSCLAPWAGATAQTPAEGRQVAPVTGSVQETALQAAQAYSKTDAYKRLITQAVARVPASVAPRCPKFATTMGSFDIAQPLQVAPGAVGGLTAGAWRQVVLTHGCGDDTQLNFFFFAGPDGRVLTVVGVPGTSRADLAQQRDARTYALVALSTAAPACGHYDTVGTRFESFGSKLPPVPDPGAETQYRPWWETWTMAGCGKRFDLPLNFTPNRLGTQIVQPGGITPR